LSDYYCVGLISSIIDNGSQSQNVYVVVSADKINFNSCIIVFAIVNIQV